MLVLLQSIEEHFFIECIIPPTHTMTLAMCLVDSSRPQNFEGWRAPLAIVSQLFPPMLVN